MGRLAALTGSRNAAAHWSTRRCSPGHGWRGRWEWAMLDGAEGGSAAAPEPAVTVLDGRLPGARLLRPTDALDDSAGRALQRVAADVLACAPPFVLVDLSAVDTVTADGV